MMQILRIHLLIALFITLIAFNGQGQPSLKLKNNEYSSINLNISYGAHLPTGAMQERFGFHFSLGGGLEYMTNPDNLIIGLESHYIFGGNVKEDVLSNIKTYDGEIIGNDIQFASIVLRERGMYNGIVVGKLFNTHPVNKKEGIRATLSAGYIWHKIRLQDDYESAPQISGDYKKGYDRLTGGFALQQFIGYQKLDRSRRVNFTAGFEFTQGFTRSIRTWNFDQMAAPSGKIRPDFIFGIRLAWTLPFYVGMPSEDFFY